RISATDLVRICLLAPGERAADGQALAVAANDPDALGAAVERAIAGRSMAEVYFLGAMHAGLRAPDDFSISQELGCFALFRLLKALGRLGLGNAPLRFKVITADLCDVSPAATLRGFSGSTQGLARSAAREFAQWQLACLDISAADIEADPAGCARHLIETVIPAAGAERALRAGQWFERVLAPATLPAPSRAPFVPRGTYLIFGGAGGIGYELSKYLAENFAARLVWMG